jgi:hypothetical protein
VARWLPLHPEFTRAIRLLAPLDVPAAEAWRLLRPVAARIGLPRPTYDVVRRRLNDERRRLELREAARDDVVTDLLAGLVMRPLWRSITK